MIFSQPSKPKLMILKQRLTMPKIEILLNDTVTPVESSWMLSDALESWGYDSQTIAVALNDSFVPRQEYGKQSLSHEDRLEVVTPYAGG